MTRIRIRPAGFDARPHRLSSLRANAQRAYRAAAERDESLKDPTPDPAPPSGRSRPSSTGYGEGEQAVPGAEQGQDRAADAHLTPLTLQVRALYEAGVVPVAEIARLAGVSVRTLYKYVSKGGWRRRHATQDIASAVAKRASKRKPRACVTAKGAGGRFIANADVGLPFVRGLKALDPHGEAQARAQCLRAAALADEAAGRALSLREAMSDVRTLSILAGALRDIVAIEDAARPAAARPKADLDAMRAELARRIEASLRDGEEVRRLPAPPPAAEDEPESEQDRRLNAIAARFMLRRDR